MTQTELEESQLGYVDEHTSALEAQGSARGDSWGGPQQGVWDGLALHFVVSVHLFAHIYADSASIIHSCKRQRPKEGLPRGHGRESCLLDLCRAVGVSGRR